MIFIFPFVAVLLLIGLGGATYRLGQSNAPEPTPASTSAPKVIIIRPTPLPQVVIVQKAAPSLAPLPQMIPDSGQREFVPSIAPQVSPRIRRRTAVAARPQAASRELDWIDVGKWEGAGVKNTQVFHIGHKQGLLMWSADPDSDSIPGLVQIYIYDADNQLVDLAANEMVSSRKHGNTYFKGDGDYYLKINCANIDYSITVADYK